jgi:hypothetical protein
MSMSLDGYIAGPDDGPGNPGGDGFMRLHEWLATADGDSGRPPGPARSQGGEEMAAWSPRRACQQVRAAVRRSLADLAVGDDVEHGLPVLAMPTIYADSEVNPLAR